MDRWIDDSLHKLDYRLVNTGAVYIGDVAIFYSPFQFSFVCSCVCFIPLFWIQDISQMSSIAVYHLLSFCCSLCSPDPLQHVLGESTQQSEETVTMAYPASLVKCPLWCPSSGEFVIVPPTVSFQWRKCDKVPSTVSFQWRKCDKVPSTVSFQWRKRDIVPSSDPFQWRKRDKVSTVVSFQRRKRDKVPSMVSFQSIKHDKVPSTVPFQWRKHDKVSTVVSFQWRKHDKVPSMVSFQSRKCDKVSSMVSFQSRKCDKVSSTVSFQCAKFNKVPSIVPHCIWFNLHFFFSSPSNILSLPLH